MSSRTNRQAGYVMMAAGVIITITALFMDETQITWALLGVAILGGGVAIAASARGGGER